MNDSSWVKLFNLSKSISLEASFQTNSRRFREAPEESIPQSFTPLIIKGITVVLILIPPALPHAATIPPGFV